LDVAENSVDSIPPADDFNPQRVHQKNARAGDPPQQQRDLDDFDARFIANQTLPDFGRRKCHRKYIG
jgi:hypothetical protein